MFAKLDAIFIAQISVVKVSKGLTPDLLKKIYIMIFT